MKRVGYSPDIVANEIQSALGLGINTKDGIRNFVARALPGVTYGQYSKGFRLWFKGNSQALSGGKE